MVDPAQWVEMAMGYVVLTIASVLAVMWLYATVMGRKYPRSSEEMLARTLLAAGLICAMLLAGAALGLVAM